MEHNKNRFQHIVTKEEAGKTYKSIVKKNFQISTRLYNKIKRQDLFTVDGKCKRLFLEAKEGEILKIKMPEEKSDFPAEKDIPIVPLYEDDDILIVNKPAGYVVHPTHTYTEHTMVNGLMQYMIDTNQSFKVRLINRLDMDTSGVLAFAKNSHAQDHIVKQMAKKEVTKKYIALVEGIVDNDEGTIDLPIGRLNPQHVRRQVFEEGQPSVTHYKVLERFYFGEKDNRNHTLVELILETGRTHQIRVHMSHIGHSIAGDDLYGGSMVFIERQSLHAKYLKFSHPVTGEIIEIEAPIPSDIEEVIEKYLSKCSNNSFS